MRALRLHIDRIQRLACRHEQPVSLLAAEADIGAGLGQFDLANARAVRGEDVHAVIAVTDPAGADPGIAVGIDAKAIRKTRFAVERLVGEHTWSGKLVAVESVLADDVLSVW